MAQAPPHTAPRTESGDAGVADLLRQLRDESSELIRKEVALAKTEVTEKTSRLLRNIAYVLTGAAIAHLGLIFLLLAGSEAISLGFFEAGLEYLAPWLGPLIIGLVVAVIGYAFIQKAISTLRNESLAPQKTVDSLKEDQQWLKHKAT